MNELTPREREVAELVSEGLSNKEIAARLTIEVATVKSYVEHVFDKTGTDNRVRLARVMWADHLLRGGP